jgi:hypothetical protein
MVHEQFAAVVAECFQIRVRRIQDVASCPTPGVTAVPSLSAR